MAFKEIDAINFNRMTKKLLLFSFMAISCV